MCTDEEKVRELQRGHGEWNENMRKVQLMLLSQVQDEYWSGEG